MYINDLLLVVSAVGTAVMLFPYLRRWNEQLALGYLCFRFMEAVFIAIGLVSILGLVHLSTVYEADILASGNLHAVGLMLQSFHRWTFVLGPNLMLGLNTVMYSYLLFRTGLVAKTVSNIRDGYSHFGIHSWHTRHVWYNRSRFHSKRTNGSTSWRIRIKLGPLVNREGV